MMTDTDKGGILLWTGHPLVDAGIAALTAFAGKSDPAMVTGDDLDRFGEFAEQHYLIGDLTKTVDVLFTRNSFLNPSFKDDRKRQEIRDALGAYARRGSSAFPRCVYCGRPGLRVLHRDHIPMLSGRGIPNFYPQGNPGLAICGACQVALHGLTLGAPRVCGKALVVQSDDPQLTLRLVRRWVADAMRFAQLANAGGEVPKVSGPQTRLVEALLKSQQETLDNESSAGLVAYHLSNSGQGPDIHIFELPSTVVSFLKRARSQRTAQAWGEIERRAWQQVNRTLSAADVPEDERLQYRNYLYDDLFRLPEEAGRFIRLYFLRRAVGLVRSTDPRARYSTAAEADIVSWDLTVLFLEEILSMEQRRIDAIRSLADRLAEEIDTDNNRRLFRNAYAARYYPQVRQLLIRANFHRLQRDAAPVLTFDDYLEVFEEGDELARADWRLAWDLMLIRLIEQLYHRGWLRTNREVLNEVAQDEEEQVQEVEPAAASADA